MSPYLRQVISLVLLLVFSSQSFSAMAMPCQTQTQTQTQTQFENITQANHHMHPMGHSISPVAATDMHGIHALGALKNDDKRFADHNCCKIPGHCFASSCAHFTVNPGLVIITQQQSILAIPFQPGVLPLPPDTSLYRPPIFA